MIEHCSRMCKALSAAPRVWREWEAERKESQPLSGSLRPPNTTVGWGGVGEQTEAGLGGAECLDL